MNHRFSTDGVIHSKQTLTRSHQILILKQTLKKFGTKNSKYMPKASLTRSTSTVSSKQKGFWEAKKVITNNDSVTVIKYTLRCRIKFPVVCLNSLNKNLFKFENKHAPTKCRDLLELI